MITLNAKELLDILVAAERYLGTDLSKEQELIKSTERIKKATSKISEQLFQQEWRIDDELIIETKPF